MSEILKTLKSYVGAGLAFLEFKEVQVMKGDSVRQVTHRQPARAAGNGVNPQCPPEGARDHATPSRMGPFAQKLAMSEPWSPHLGSVADSLQAEWGFPAVLLFFFFVFWVSLWEPLVAMWRGSLREEERRKRRERERKHFCWAITHISYNPAIETVQLSVWGHFVDIRGCPCLPPCLRQGLCCTV